MKLGLCIKKANVVMLDVSVRSSVEDESIVRISGDLLKLLQGKM